MDHPLVQSVGFWTFLFSVDEDLAATAPPSGMFVRRTLASGGLPAQAAGRPKGVVSGTLLSVEFLLWARGLPQAIDSALGAVLGRKVYLHAAVILVAAMRQGPTP